MSEPNPQESTTAGNPPAVNLTVIVAGIALLLVVAMVVLVMMNMTDDFGSGGEVITTPSGLKYIDVKIGEGKEAKAGDKVVVHYTGRLKDGTKFDSSHDRKKSFPFELGSGGVIKGWDEGVAGMKEGGKRKLIIPHELGYGATGSDPKIPAFAELHFDVELLKVN